MVSCDRRWLKLLAAMLLMLLAVCVFAPTGADAKRTKGKGAPLSACQHLRRVENRRAKSLSDHQVRVPRCNKRGEFEPIQCRDEVNGTDCWCVDEYGVEIPSTRNETRANVTCREPEHCSASACRMFCPSGFDRDPKTGCNICRCRDVCEGVVCPNGQSCQMTEVKCKTEPCPPVPTCKKARAVGNFCPAGLPLAIDGAAPRPFLCGLEEGKPQCPLLYKCMVEPGNDYGVCCPSTMKFQKPGICPAVDKVEYTESTGYMCGSPCTHDLECRNSEKCCFTKGCQMNCQQPFNVTSCHQARALSEILAVNEREGRGYVPDCTGPGGMFAPRQCSRNGLVCWCVDPRTGHKIPSSMGAANMVDCDGWENMISRSLGRSFNMEQCDANICAAVCEYGFKNDHNGCPTCECSDPCEGFQCPMNAHCEVATDPLCESNSALCASWPVCKLDLVYSNPCEVGTPYADNSTGEVMYCYPDRQSRAYQPQAFFEPDTDNKESRAMGNHIVCPSKYKCTKLHGQEESVCCPKPEESLSTEQPIIRQQTMCEYLRDFSERMESIEQGMQLAVPPPQCTDNGAYLPRQCQLRTIKVTRAEKRKILEANTIRRMRMLLENPEYHAASRSKRNVNPIKLFRVDDSLLKVSVAEASVIGRSAKVIDMGANRQQQLGNIFETDFKKVIPAPKIAVNDNELVNLQVEECWCVDNFGTEIPRTRGFNVTDETCAQLREEISCLDLTCRMGCEYGFTLDVDSRCPACQCRDPCEGVDCGENKECRIVDVSCDDEYCPPVPACLPRKPGQCPFLVPPGPDNYDANACAYECRTDSHCEGTKRCCSNGCGTLCVEPQMKTACQHLQAIQLHQAAELGIPAMKIHIAQCDAKTGVWNEVQCAPNNTCWCVDVKTGIEVNGTRVAAAQPTCTENSAHKCAELKCEKQCEGGFKMNEQGCPICECRNFCDEIHCGLDEECQLINVECVNAPCPKMPICVPRRESICPEGEPFRQGDVTVSCGPQNENEICPTTHTCQLNPVTHRGVCCTKTRDVCFESLDENCLAKQNSERNVTVYRFNPKVNKCVPFIIDENFGYCQSKNIFHSEFACNSVCPVLTQCERLKLKNNLAAQRTGHSSVWFEPRCDPVTGHWSPVQCLGKQPTPPPMHKIEANRALEIGPSAAEFAATSPYGVCWCADKKGAPLKGTLTRDLEPICNGRQGRGRSLDSGDALMEDLIRQMTILNDIEEDFPRDEVERLETAFASKQEELKSLASSAVESTVTERVITLANALLDSQLSVETAIKPLQVTTTRCHALAKTAPFPVSCDEAGAFLPKQCNNKLCWCVDAAGNQVDESNMFTHGSQNCAYTPISSVAAELYLYNITRNSIRNVYDTIRLELQQLLGDVVENLRVHENFDGSVVVRFELHNEQKVDLAFAIESAISAGEFKLGGGNLKADITRSHFIYRSENVPSLVLAQNATENTLQLVLFIMATSSAFLISVFVVYVMLKRGRHQKGINQYGYPIYAADKVLAGGGDKPVDFSAPIFVLSPAERDNSLPVSAESDSSNARQ